MQDAATHLLHQKATLALVLLTTLVRSQCQAHLLDILLILTDLPLSSLQTRSKLRHPEPDISLKYLFPLSY